MLALSQTRTRAFTARIASTCKRKDIRKELQPQDCNMQCGMHQLSKSQVPGLLSLGDLGSLEEMQIELKV